MKNLFTGKEIQTISLSDFTMQLIGKEKEQRKLNSADSQANQLRGLRDEISLLKAENELYRNAFSEMAKPETNSIAKIRTIAKQVVGEEGRQT